MKKLLSRKSGKMSVKWKLNLLLAVTFLFVDLQLTAAVRIAGQQPQRLKGKIFTKKDNRFQ